LSRSQAIDLGPGTSETDWELENRSAAYATLQCQNKRICAASTHLASNASRPSDIRAAQLNKLLSSVEKEDADVNIIGGDFNAYRHSPDLEEIEEKYKTIDVGPTCSLVDGPEYLVWDIDRVYVQGQAVPLTSRKLIDKSLSDHAMVLSDFIEK
jgi:endonuclease/exonuclease/phosphatase family metal-dependent hydrolase